MSIDTIVSVLFVPAAVMAVVMAAANVIIVLAKLSHHERIAQRIARTASQWTWPLRMGGGSVGVRRNHAR